MRRIEVSLHSPSHYQKRIFLGTSSWGRSRTTRSDGGKSLSYFFVTTLQKEAPKLMRISAWKGRTEGYSTHHHSPYSPLRFTFPKRCLLSLSLGTRTGRPARRNGSRRLLEMISLIQRLPHSPIYQKESCVCLDAFC